MAYTVSRLKIYEFMNSLNAKYIFIVTVILLGRGTSCFARPVPIWSYETLVANSDFVAIVEPLENRPVSDAFPGDTYGHSQDDFAPTNTRFKVHAVFKGGTIKEVTVLHFSYSTKVNAIANGAMFIQFYLGPLEYEKRAMKDGKPVGGMMTYQEQPIWIAFLKHRKDGRFEPVTGHYDSALSFREFHTASFYGTP